MQGQFNFLYNSSCCEVRPGGDDANNFSVWMVHCHILQHMILGMQAVFMMGNSSEITRGTSPDLVSGYLTYGGDAYGNMTYDPLVNHFGDP